MEDSSARVQYPSMLSSLQPTQAAQTLNDRVKRINRTNIEIADWLQERRRVEEQYVTGLRRLALLKLSNSQSELGVFQEPWERIVQAANTIAGSHYELAKHIERDVEAPLRNFGQRPDATNITTMCSNLTSMAKTLEEAQHASEKLEKKGGKASTHKVDTVSAKLESATQQWESQAPYIFESLQALDEMRVNHLRDVLTQYQTHEADCAQRVQDTTAETLAQVIEVSTEAEVLGFASRATAGKPRVPTLDSTRRSSTAETYASTAPPSTGGSAALAPPSALQPTPPESQRDGQPSPTPAAPEPAPEHKPDSKLRRLGTLFGARRRQSVHGGFGLSPQKGGSSTFGRLGSRDGRGVSPRGSSSNLHESRLAALAEAPPVPRTPQQEEATTQKPAHEGTNGVTASDNLMDSPVPAGVVGRANGTHESTLLAEEPRPQPPAQATQGQVSSPPTKDAEGFTIPAPVNDPISAAQKEAAAAGDEADQLFKLNIQNKPVEEEDPDEKRAALSNVANSLKANPVMRRAGTVRGRRDVRNTIYAPSPNAADSFTEGSVPGLTGSPSLPSSFSSRPTAVAALASEPSIAGTSDTRSVRSGNSLGSLPNVKHADMTGPGLNSSIVESVSVLFEGSELKNASISGEIAFVNNPSDENMFKTHEIVRINNFTNLEKIGPNRIFVQNTSPDQPDQFSLDMSHLNKTAPAFSYRVFAPESEPLSLGQNAPLLLNPVWKPQGDKLGLLIQYQLNPSTHLTAPVSLHNVVIFATYEGRATGAQTKPSGTHLRDKHLVYWRLGDITLTPEPQKIICRIIGAEGIEPAAGHVETRWEYTVPEGGAAGSGISISRLQESKGKGKEVMSNDPFADEDTTQAADQTWVDVPMTRKLVGGKYQAR